MGINSCQFHQQRYACGTFCHIFLSSGAKVLWHLHFHLQCVVFVWHSFHQPHTVSRYSDQCEAQHHNECVCSLQFHVSQCMFQELHVFDQPVQGQRE